jgi:nucleotide-binding universal stress UspA family protein
MSDTPKPTLILPLDGSEMSQRAKGLAVAIAERLPARLVLVGAPEVYGLDLAWYGGAVPEAGIPMVPVTELMQEARQATADFLAEQQQQIDVQGIEVATALVDEMPARAIVQTAEAEQAALIVMATHGLGGLSRWAMGSVADKVLQSTHVPVLLVRADAEHLDPQLDQILIALDGSELAEAVLAHVTPLARAHGSTVTLATVSVEARLGLETSAMLAAQEHAVERMQEYLAKIVDRLKVEGVTAEIETLAGDDPAEVLLERAGRGDVDLIALTTHGRGGLSRWAYGSVADRLIRHADTPVLVLRSQAPDAK